MSRRLRHRHRAMPWAGAALLACLVCSSAAQATALAGGVPDASPRPLRAAPTSGAEAATLDLASGRIDAVAADGRSITLQGRQVPLHPSQLLVLAPGGQRYHSAQVLRPGMRLRFALEPLQPGAAPGRSPAASALPAAQADASRRIVLIYIESAP